MSTMHNQGIGTIGVIGIIITLFYIAVIVGAVYGMILYFKLAHRGIKALDIYIREKENKANQMQMKSSDTEIK